MDNMLRKLRSYEAVVESVFMAVLALGTLFIMGLSIAQI